VIDAWHAAKHFTKLYIQGKRRGLVGFKERQNVYGLIHLVQSPFGCGVWVEGTLGVGWLHCFVVMMGVALNE
jgi:hypothetical protein